MESLVTARGSVFAAGLAIQQAPATYGFPCRGHGRPTPQAANADFIFISDDEFAVAQEGHHMFFE
jgi:hypothetical protein